MPRLIFNPFSEGLFDFVNRPGEGDIVGDDLSSQIDGIASSFTTTADFVHTTPVGTGPTIAVYHNGQRLRFGGGNDYTVSESGGPGTGFDTVDLNFTPLAAPGNPDTLTVDYVEA